MKIGILTLHRHSNYGAVLQCFALARKLREMACESTVLDFAPEFTRQSFFSGWGFRSGTFVTAGRRKWVKWRHGPANRRSFEQFRSEFLPMSRPLSENALNEEINSFEILIVGSDQVWNSRIAFHPAYYLNFGIKKYKGIKASYAASCGMSEQPNCSKEAIRTWLPDLSYVSVRDEVSSQMLREIAGINATPVVDPCLLVDFKPLARPVELPFNEYLLIYGLGHELHSDKADIVGELKRLTGLPVINVVGSADTPHGVHMFSDVVLYRASPEEWVWLMLNAAFVCTDSFHGTLFALKYEKQFVAFIRDLRQGTRIIDLAERFGVLDRIVTCATDIINRDLVNRKWSAAAVGLKIQKESTESVRFINKLIGFQTEDQNAI